MYRFSIAASLTICWLSVSSLQAQDSEDVFSKLDENSDGILVEEEVPEAQRRFFERLVRAGDENQDGKLSKAEYAATLKNDEQPAGDPGRGPGGPGQRRGGPGAGPGQPGGPGGPFQGRMSPEMLSRLDRNQDGKLSKDEIPEPMQERMNQLFERLGTDSISIEQLQTMGRPGGDRPGQRPEAGEGRNGQRPPRDGGRPDGPPREGARPGPGPEGQAMNRGPGGPGFGGPGGRPGFGGPGFGGPGFGGPEGGPAFLRILDENRDGNISKEEALRVAKLFDELDRNNDGQLNMPELMGFAGEGFPGPMARDGDRRPGGDRPDRPAFADGDRPRPEGDRPDRGRPPEDRPEGDRPRPEGARPDGGRPDGFRGGFQGGRGGSGFGGFGMIGQLQSEDVRSELSLTDDQQAKIRELQSDSSREQMGELFGKMRAATSEEDREKLREEAREFMEKAREDQEAKLKEILNEEQFKKLSEMRERGPGPGFRGGFGRPDGDRPRAEGDRPDRPERPEAE